MENERLEQIFDKTDGNCHICHDKLCFTNYAAHGLRGAWEVEHSIPKSKGGTDHLNNLYAAHISCNRQKGVLHTKTARARHGNTRAPYSKARKEEIKNTSTASGALIGSGIGLLVGGPAGAFIGSILGGWIGNSSSPVK